MEVAKIQVGGTCACAYEKKTIRAGMVGVTVSFAFDEYWVGLNKIAVYRCGGVVRDEYLEGDTGTIPAEVLTKSGFDLEVGVYGTDAEKQIAIPTCWANLGVVRPGADPSGDPAADLSLPIWAQILAKLGNLADLSTEAKENLVAAINEALTKGGGEIDPEEIGRIVDGYLEENPPAAYTLPIATETTLGGVKAAAATEEMTQPVGITEDGKLVTTPGQNSGGNVDLTGYATEQWVKNQKYLTDVPEGYARDEDIPTKPEDIGALPDTYTPPNQTAEQVGADPKGTAASAVSQHNASNEAHGDIRLELKAINDRLTAFFDSDDQTLDELSEIVAYITSNKSLIDAITTTKINIADIINNLTTNVSDKPLSAAQGVVLKGLIDTVSNSLSNYALKSAIPTKVSQLSNDKGYLTQHQDISGKLDASALPTAINTALAQAKASGEFDGEDGYIPVKGTDYWTEADKASMIQDVIDALGGTPVFGVVDANNNIILTGNLADGTYTLKYEDADGNVTTIGTLNHSNAPEVTYTNLFDPTTASINTRMSGSSSASKVQDGYVMTANIVLPSPVAVGTSYDENTPFIAVPSTMWSGSANLFGYDGEYTAYLDAGSMTGTVVGAWKKIPIYTKWSGAGTITSIVVSLYVKGSAITRSDIQNIEIYFNEIPE